MVAIGTIAGVILNGIILYGTIAGILFLLQIVAYWRIFTKAGEPGWKSIIPVYNVAIQFKISWSITAFWVLIAAVIGQGILGPFMEKSETAGAVVALLGFLIGVIHIISSFKLAKCYGRGFFFGLGLCIFPTLFKLILGLGESRYVGPNGVTSGYSG